MARIRYRGSRSYYEHKYRAFGNEVLRAPFMQREMRQRANDVYLEAVRIAPVDTGEYVRSFEVDSGVRQTGRTRRAYGRVTNTSAHAMAVEFGWANTPRYRVLGKASSAAQGTLRAGA